MLAHLKQQWSTRPTPRKEGIKRRKNLQVQTELIEQQKWEIDILKATQATGVSPQQLVNAILQAMSCLCVGNKDSTRQSRQRWQEICRDT